MGWVRISDDFYDHDKFQSVTALGVAVWIAGLAHANRNLTDGVVSKRAAQGLVSFDDIGKLEGNYGGHDADATDGIAELLDAGLWHDNGHDCDRCLQPGRGFYFIHDYFDFQPSREAVESKSKMNAEKGRKGGKASALKRTAKPVAKPSAKPVAKQAVKPELKPNPTPNPKSQPQVPSPKPDELTIGQSGLSHVTRASDEDPTDGIELIQWMIEHEVLVPSPTIEETEAWAADILSRASGHVGRPIGYLKRVIERSPDETDQWFVDYRRNQMRAVSQ